MREVFRTAGRPIVLTAASSSLEFETAENSVVAMPSLRKRDFSARRSCAASRAAGGGETGERAAGKRGGVGGAGLYFGGASARRAGQFLVGEGEGWSGGARWSA